MTTITPTRALPYQVAPDTFVVPWFMQAPPVGYFCMNSLVIRGAEPVIVDTGSPANRDEWLENVWSLVEPEDVRWIFLSHDDRDHSGNLLPVLEACPNATRTLTAVRPPVFDNPTTRGLFDDRTGVFWAVDTCALPVAGPMADVTDISDGDFDAGQLLGVQLVAPWHQWLDEQKFCAHVDRVQSMPIEVIASCHAPAISGARIGRSFDLLRRIHSAEPWAGFTQQDLDQWMAAMAAGGGAPTP